MDKIYFSPVAKQPYMAPACEIIVLETENSIHSSGVQASGEGMKEETGTW